MTNIEPVIIPETPNAPIACDLTDAPDTPEERLAEYGRLFAHALAGRERTAEAVELRFAAKPGVAQWVADLARREAACCPFLTHQVSADGTHVIWRISTQAGPAAQAILDEVQVLPERFGDGFKGLVERLDARGFKVVSPDPRHFVVDDGQRKPGILDRVKAACGC
jgi:hypothetical protein